jgi:hypothetical protein
METLNSSNIEEKKRESQKMPGVTRKSCKDRNKLLVKLVPVAILEVSILRMFIKIVWQKLNHF